MDKVWKGKIRKNTFLVSGLKENNLYIAFNLFVSSIHLPINRFEKVH